MRQLCDETIASELKDTLAHDTRTAELDLDLAVRDRVAHVRGEIGSETQRFFLRRFVRRQSGLLAVWDLLGLLDRRAEVLDIGCGERKQVPWATGVDSEPYPGVDLVCDLERSLPFRDDSFDNIFAVHVFEHIRDLLGLMRELHRILRPTGALHVLTPNWRFVNAVADPTHSRFLDVQTFKYFCRSKPGVLPWRPLSTGAAVENIFADLQPVKSGQPASREELARWFA
jgi:SAM-dependent methyltransferase